MNPTPDTPNDDPKPDAPRLSPADAEALDALLEHGGPPAPPAGSRGIEQVLGLLDQWSADEPTPGLARRALAGVITSEPVSLSAEDVAALDAVLALRRAGLTAGPMPAGSRARAERVTRLLSVLDCSAGEPVPEGLVGRTMQAVERDRAEQQRRAALAAAAGGRWRPAGGSIRQIATTAALLLMVLSVLLPVLDKSRRDAMIAQCGENLAGLGVQLDLVAKDNKSRLTPPSTPQPPAIFSHLSEFASRDIDGSRVPASRVNLFVLFNQQQVSPQNLQCPAAESADTAYYNGQNPVAGGPFRLYLRDNTRPVFADTNPLYRLTPNGLVRDASIPGMTRSKNHDGVGQNVLINDGSVQWKVRPAVVRPGDPREDNIWLYQRPAPGADEPDVFLTP